jgi:adenylate cyclase
VSDQPDPVTMLRGLLDRAVDRPHQREEVAREIEATFGRDQAVLVGDMDSFTATAARHGIVTFLVLIHQVERLLRPVLERHRGRLLKSHADTFFCLFDRVDDAFAAAREMNCLLSEARTHLPESRLTLAIGIGYGRILVFGDEDALGSEVNFAYKLGEDIGQAGEILLTQSARDALPGEDANFERREAVVSGLSLPYYAARS